jgi:hypothetical protein
MSGLFVPAIAAPPAAFNVQAYLGEHPHALIADPSRYAVFQRGLMTGENNADVDYRS